MTTDLLLAAISLAGLLGYATVGVAVARVSGPLLRRGCVVAYGTVHGRCGIDHDHDDDTHERSGTMLGATWPISLTIVGLAQLVYRVVLLAARGPTAWGTALARLLTGRAERRAALVRQVADRDRRIAELEREVLG